MAKRATKNNPVSIAFDKLNSFLEEEGLVIEHHPYGGFLISLVDNPDNKYLVMHNDCSDQSGELPPFMEYKLIKQE